MAESVPDFESAVLTTYAPNPSAAIALVDQSSTTKTLVRSDQPQFGVLFGASKLVGGAIVAGTRPDEWLLLGSNEAVSGATSAVDHGGLTNVIEFTHGRSMFRATGQPTASMLEKVCGIDWSDNMTPDGAVVTASVALTTCDIIRNDVDGVRSYVLLCDRSFGQYLFDALMDASTEWNTATP